MRIVVGANVVLSAYAFGSLQIQEALKYVYLHHEMLIPDQVINEVLSVTERKIPVRLPAMNQFIRNPAIQVIATGANIENPETIVRDASDQPILDAAIAVDADVIISGDRGFIALAIDRPRIMTPREFINEFMHESS